MNLSDALPPIVGFRLHHVGLVVADIPATVETYVRRHGFERRTDLIHDPLQGAYVQFVRLPGDSTYLEFVSPDGPESKLQNALAKGLALHHLCYSTADIERACADLRNSGMSLVRSPVPAVAFAGRRIAWLMARDRVLMELVERGPEGEL